MIQIRDYKRVQLFLMTVVAFIGTATAQSFKLKSNGEAIEVFEQNDVPLSYKLNTYKYTRVVYNGQPLSLEIVYN
jgi:hypothetical protein